MESKADWLRSEIEKLEESIKEVENPTICYGTDIDITEVPLELNTEMKGFINGWKTALTSIITRYKEELKVLESK